MRDLARDAIAFETVLVAEGRTISELHMVASPPGAPRVRFVSGDAPGAQIRIGRDPSGPASVAAKVGPPGALVGISRRPGIVTPEDIVSTVYHMLGEPRSERLRAGAPVDLPALRARLLRDAGTTEPLAIATVVVGSVLILAGTAARSRGRIDLARRISLALLLVPAGYVAGLFVPSSSGIVRAVAVLVAPIPALARRPGRADHAAAAAAIAVAVALLTLIAALRPSGEPALSIWGNPLESWRFFGLRNHLAAFLAGSVIVWLALARPRRAIAIATGIAAAVVVGAPRLGANFGGVLTLVAGMALAIHLTGRSRVGARALLTAGALAVGAMSLALVSDTGSPVSHGGRAVRSVADGGLGALASILENRARLNLREVTDLGVIGYAGAAVVTGVLIYLLLWGARNLPRGTAVAAFACSAAALLALVTEDSGFFTAGILGLYPAAVWISDAPEARGARPG